MNHLLFKFFAPALIGGVLVTSASAAERADKPPEAKIDFVDIDKDITLRRMVVRNAHPKGTVLLLHGFPESVYAYKDIAVELGKDYDVHAFDWPGYGLSSRPSTDRFAYAPKDYARVLGQYIAKAGLDRSTLTIYATDIGALPALLLALDEPDIAKTIIVGDFAPFDRPAYMYESLQALKAQPKADQVRAFMNKNRDEILANTFFRGLPDDARYEIPREFKEDIARAWSDAGTTTPVDAFANYYAHFTRDQDHFESNVARLRTPVKIVWGEKDVYIKTDMGAELARKTNVELRVLPGVGHYPHLQAPAQAIEEIRASFR
ncbi:alpha/beta hydrolase [Lysobacter sp. A6]|uniref:Alpha/beta hydrolase n=1 Tax=Noviluteimonas lactosilytica TaxID=2888523 RepID=A0ABS8JGB6_9GAMM|nr:alpha/beta hydrolase [Lysobacter lactosilyticus]MCC8362632.1 alpha/beta hydrolase [Lysobacter lactosilyticus]